MLRETLKRLVVVSEAALIYVLLTPLLYSCLQTPQHTILSGKDLRLSADANLQQRLPCALKRAVQVGDVRIPIGTAGFPRPLPGVSTISDSSRWGQAR